MSKSNTKKFLKKSGNKTHKKKYQKKTKTTYGRKIRGGNTMKYKKGGFIWPFTSTPKPTQPDGQQQQNGFGNMFGLFKKPTKEELLANLDKEKQKCIDDINSKIANVNKTNSQAPAAPAAPGKEAVAPAPAAEPEASEPAPEEYSPKPPQPQPQQQPPRLGGLKRKHRKHM